jgi:hypothetical protein
MNAYARILRAPHMRPLFLSMLLTRLPLGLNSLATVLFLRERAYSAPGHPMPVGAPIPSARG